MINAENMLFGITYVVWYNKSTHCIIITRDFEFGFILIYHSFFQTLNFVVLCFCLNLKTPSPIPANHIRELFE